MKALKWKLGRSWGPNVHLGAIGAAEFHCGAEGGGRDEERGAHGQFYKARGRCRRF